MIRIIYLLLLFLSITSCAIQQQSISKIQDWSYPQVQFDTKLNFSFIDHVLEKTNNNRGERWAQRNNIHVLGVKLINTSDKPIHGTQISFILNGEKAEILQNKWLAQKVRKRNSPFLVLFLPAFIIESAIYDAIFNNEDEYGINDHTNDMAFQSMSGKVANGYRNERKKANLSLTQEFMDFQIASKILWPGETIYGLIGIRSNNESINLNAEVSESDFFIIK